MNNLFNELKRRNVFRVGAAYVVVGWLVLQVVDTVAPLLQLPDAFGRGVLLILAIGLPVALVLAWAYELTPEGVKKTEEVDASESIAPSTGRKLNIVIIASLVLALGYFIWESRFQDRAAPPEAPQIADADRPTIAVLPFVNMSNDPEQEFFSDGITEEILNILVREPALKVVSRTSAFSLKGQSLDIPTIAERLGATYIVEGSVRRADDDLRITAQLIEAASDTHLWSDSYDRPYRDVFAVQEEIAGAISTALSEKLGFTARTAGDGASRIDDLAVYEDFLRARAQLRKRDLDDAVASFRRVVAQAPDYGPAWSHYSISLSYLTDMERDHPLVQSGQARFTARRAARQAMALAPEDAFSHYALGYMARQDHRPLDELHHYEDALAIDPENAFILEDYVQALLVALLPERAAEYSERLLAVDPLWEHSVSKYAKLQWMLGNTEAALEAEREVVRLSSDDIAFALALLNSLIKTGRWDEARTTQQQMQEAFASLTPQPALFHLDLNAVQAWADSAHPPPLSEAPFLSGLEGTLSSVTRSSLMLISHDDRLFEAIGNINRSQIARILDDVIASSLWRPYWDDPRTKEFILDLERRWDLSLPAVWREYGWPKYCRPLGEEDFECGTELAQ